MKEYGNTASIPRIKRRTADGNYKADQVSFSLAPDMVEKLTEAAQNWGVTLNTLFMSIWGVLLHRYNAADDAVLAPSFRDARQRLTGLNQWSVCLSILFQCESDLRKA